MAPTSTICEARERKFSESDDDDSNLSPVTRDIHGKFGPLVIILVGLPACGKTVLAHKLQHYFSWTNKRAKVFSVSFYRRKHVEFYISHNLFRSDNRSAFEIRRLSMHEAQEDATVWLKSGGDVSILDGTHATQSLREEAYNHFAKQMGFKVLFLECVCNDEELLEANVKEILQFSKDYKQMSIDKALDDFHHKIEHYRAQYQTVHPKMEAHYSYIKVFNAGESLSVHQLQGSLEREVLNFVSSFTPTSKTYYFSRHGESEFNMLGKIGGDANLSPRGKMYAIALARYINDASIPGLHVWTSQKKRTKQTVQDINAPKEHIAYLDELDAGVCEGLSYEEMQEKYPQEFAWRDQDKLRYRYPWGESYIDIMSRLQPILMELERENNLLVVSHQAVLRCILGYFLNKRPEELPYINVPLHTVVKLTTYGYKYKMEIIKLNVECVDTYRQQPQNCSTKRTADEALQTVPSHFEPVKTWIPSPPLIEQH